MLLQPTTLLPAFTSREAQRFPSFLLAEMHWETIFQFDHRARPPTDALEKQLRGGEAGLWAVYEALVVLTGCMSERDPM